MTKIVQGIYKSGSVIIKEPNAAGRLEELIITDALVIGTMSISADSKGYVILCDDVALFIPENPAAATTELLKVLSAAINQLTLLIDLNLPLIAAAIASLGGVYTPVLATPIMQPVVLAAAQLQQTTSVEPSTKLPELPLPPSIDKLDSREIEELIQEQEDKVNVLNLALGTAVSTINGVLAPIMNIIELINAFSSAGIETAKASLQQAKDYKQKLKDKKTEKEQEEQV